MKNQREDGQLSPSGVWVATDFRSNLIIDRYDPVFADMRASKLKHLRSVNSEDAVTWNVFRSLRQVGPACWLPALWERAYRTIPVPSDLQATVALWRSFQPPLGLLAGGDEGDSEIDVVVETASWVWFIEAKFRRDISTGTTTRPERDQVLRNLDVGTHYAGVRQFFFSLLIVSEKTSPIGVQRVQAYADLAKPRELLKAHRPDGLANLTALGELRWTDLAEVLLIASTSAPREDERGYAVRACEWLSQRGIVGTEPRGVSI
jgi:hypothetical protein